MDNYTRKYVGRGETKVIGAGPKEAITPLYHGPVLPCEPPNERLPEATVPFESQANIALVKSSTLSVVPASGVMAAPLEDDRWLTNQLSFTGTVVVITGYTPPLELSVA